MTHERLGWDVEWWAGGGCDTMGGHLQTSTSTNVHLLLNCGTMGPCPDKFDTVDVKTWISVRTLTNNNIFSIIRANKTTKQFGSHT